MAPAQAPAIPMWAQAPPKLWDLIRLYRIVAADLRPHFVRRQQIQPRQRFEFWRYRQPKLRSLVAKLQAALKVWFSMPAASAARFGRVIQRAEARFHRLKVSRAAQPSVPAHLARWNRIVQPIEFPRFLPAALRLTFERSACWPNNWRRQLL